jgi:hypothetical protein
MSVAAGLAGYGGDATLVRTPTRVVRSVRTGATTEAASAVETGTGTVWDHVKVTQAAKPGEVVPHSFELNTPAGKVWVHPHGTKHINEYLLRNGVSHGTPVASQEMLTSLQSAVYTATKGGIKLREMMNVGNWELMFSQRASDPLPVLMHALYK